MRIPKHLAFIALLLLPGFAAADGNTLLTQCTQVERFMDNKKAGAESDIGMCLGLVQGVRTTMLLTEPLLDQKHRTCWPTDGIDNGQAVRIVLQYLRSNPALLHHDEVLLMMLAFRKAYRCAK